MYTYTHTHTLMKTATGTGDAQKGAINSTLNLNDQAGHTDPIEGQSNIGQVDIGEDQAMLEYLYNAFHTQSTVQCVSQKIIRREQHNNNNNKKHNKADKSKVVRVAGSRQIPQIKYQKLAEGI